MKKALVILAVILVAGGAWLIFERQTEIDSEETEVVAATEDLSTEELREEELISAGFNYLNALFQLHFVTIDNALPSTTDNELIISWITEALNDKNKLERILITAEKFIESDNQIIEVTGLALATSIHQLIQSHSTFVEYLRSVNPQTIDLAEFQYQLALHGSSNKDAFATLIEGTALFPGIYYRFRDGESDLGAPRISEKGLNEVINELDRLFADIFIAEDKEYEETGNRNAVVLIVRNMREFLTDIIDMQK